MKELSDTLRNMVGAYLDEKELSDIVEKVMDESDVLDHDGRISFVEFEKAILKCDLYVLF
jgi:hypothetical protein